MNVYSGNTLSSSKILNKVIPSSIVHAIRSGDINQVKSILGENVQPDKGGIYQFKKNTTKYFFLVSNIKILSSRIQYFKSPHNLSSFREELKKKFKTIPQGKGHSVGREIVFEQEGLRIIFNNNSKQNLKAIEVSW